MRSLKNNSLWIGSVPHSSIHLPVLSTDPGNKKLPRSIACPFLNEEAQFLEWERKISQTGHFG